MDLTEIIKVSELSLLETQFASETACERFLHQQRWAENVSSPFDTSSKVYVCAGNRYRCKNTKKYFNVRTNTLFHNSKVPLSVWFQAIWIIANTHKITSVALASQLNLTQKTAWYMLRRINRYFAQNGIKRKIKPAEVKKQTFAASPDSAMLPLTQWLDMLKNKQ